MDDSRKMNRTALIEQTRAELREMGIENYGNALYISYLAAEVENSISFCLQSLKTPARIPKEWSQTMTFVLEYLEKYDLKQTLVTLRRELDNTPSL